MHYDQRKTLTTGNDSLGLLQLENWEVFCIIIDLQNTSECEAKGISCLFSWTSLLGLLLQIFSTAIGWEQPPMGVVLFKSLLSCCSQSVGSFCSVKNICLAYLFCIMQKNTLEKQLGRTGLRSRSVGTHLLVDEHFLWALSHYWRGCMGPAGTHICLLHR